MPKTITARFETEPEAERALAAVAAEVPLRDSAIVSSGLAGSLMLDSLNLPPEERAACEQQLSKGGFLVVAQVVSESRGDTVLRLLHNLPVAREPEPVPKAEAPPPPEAAPEPSPPPEPEAVTEEEERIPIVEEELRIGKREVVRGRARVRSFVTETPVQEQVELFHEEAHLERRPVNRRISEAEVMQGGLLQERVIEVTEMREEAVVTKEAFVREELVVRKSVHRRVERIDETVRRTEVETERLHPEEGATADG